MFDLLRSIEVINNRLRRNLFFGYYKSAAPGTRDQHSGLGTRDSGLGTRDSGLKFQNSRFFNTVISSLNTNMENVLIRNVRDAFWCYNSRIPSRKETVRQISKFPLKRLDSCHVPPLKLSPIQTMREPDNHLHTNTQPPPHTDRYRDRNTPTNSPTQTNKHPAINTH